MASASDREEGLKNARAMCTAQIATACQEGRGRNRRPGSEFPLWMLLDNAESWGMLRFRADFLLPCNSIATTQCRGFRERGGILVGQVLRIQLFEY